MRGKFFIFLFGYIIYPFSFLIPRSKQKWAFGSFRNAFNDNAKYLFIYLSEYMPDTKIVWISAGRKTVQHIRSLGLKAEYIGSFKGLWFALRAKYWFFNAYVSDILFFASGGATCINLWHGIGLSKKVEFSITKGVLAKRYVKKTLKERFFHPECFRRPDYLLSSTPFQSAIFAEAFRIKTEQSLNIGYPRNTILLDNEEQRQTFIKKYALPQTMKLIDTFKSYDKVLIYMPTWRDSQLNVFSENMDLTTLNKIMKEKNSLLLLKPHVNTLVDSEKYSAFENILFIEKDIDVYPILPYIDVLITDYSSILYDFILMPHKKLILYIYDYHEFIEQHSFFQDYLSDIPGKICYSFTELQQYLQKDDHITNEEKRKETITKFWGADWNKTLAEISEEIITKTVKQ